MGKVNLDQVMITQLNKIEVVGGDVLHILMHTDSVYSSFGEAYFSSIHGGAIKAWKRHTRMVMNLVVPIGMVRFVFYLENQQLGRNFRVVDIGRDNYARITVPPGIWFGFQGFEKPHNLVLNLSSLIHDTAEVERKSVNEIKYDWNLDR